jgi:uncharacterized protein YggE
MKAFSTLPYIILGCLGVVALFVPIPAVGQVMMGDSTSAAGGITVYGNGEMRGMPDVVEINIRVSANAELTDDALAKHRDARERITKAFEAVKTDNLKISEVGLAVRPGNSREIWEAMRRGMAMPTTSKSQFDVSSTLRLRLTDIGKTPEQELLKTIGKLVDTAQDSGGVIGPTNDEIAMRNYSGYMANFPVMRFIITKGDVLREKAYENAVADAKSRAERLAKLHGVKLGSVTSVQEVFVSGDNNNASHNANPYQQYGPSMEALELPTGEVTAETLSGTAYRVKLLVRFAILPEQNVARQ